MAISSLRFALLLLFCTTVSLAQSVAVEELLAPHYADMVFYNGAVLTVDDPFTVAEVVAVRDDKILAIGASDTILKLAGPKTTKVDLERTQALVNSKGLERVHKTYRDLIRAPDNSGRFAGHFFEMLYDEVLPHLARETLAPLLKREFLEWFAPVGVTTVASRLKAYHISAFSVLDSRGELPVRMAYAHEIGRENPLFERDVVRGLGGIQGYGSEKLWMVGISMVQPDISLSSGLCSIFPKIKPPQKDPFPEGFCRSDQPGSVGRPTAVAAARMGLRMGGTHTAGDKVYEMAFVDLETE